MSAKQIFTSPNPFSNDERFDRIPARIEAPKAQESSWIGVDLDGTLAEYTQGAELSEIGAPIEAMMARVRKWLSQGQVVKIFTARAGNPRQVEIVKAWLAKNGLPDLEVTNVKDFGMIELWDDRCIQVTANTGLPTFASGYASDRKPKVRVVRQRSRDGKKLVSKLLITVGKFTSSWNRVPYEEFQPAALGRTK